MENPYIICDFLLINSNYLVPFRSYRSLLFKFWTLHFEPPPPWGAYGQRTII